MLLRRCGAGCARRAGGAAGTRAGGPPAPSLSCAARLGPQLRHCAGSDPPTWKRGQLAKWKIGQTARRRSHDDAAGDAAGAVAEAPVSGDPAGGGRERERTNDFTVGSQTQPQKLAGAACHALREHGVCSFRCIGHRANYQCLKALIFARQYLANPNPDKGDTGERCGFSVHVTNARIVSYDRTQVQTDSKLGTHVHVTKQQEVFTDAAVEPREDEKILTVARKTLTRNLAAAIKQQMTTSPNVSLRGIGPDAAEVMLLSLGFVRTFCENDEECNWTVGAGFSFEKLPSREEGGEETVAWRATLVRVPK